jgi:hypothetical protein
MPNEVIRLRSALPVADIASVFQRALSGRRVEFGKISDGDDPFASLETPAAFRAVASHDKAIGSWAVQIYVHDEGGARLVELHAVYHSALNRAVAGTKNTYSKSAGIKNAQAVVAALQQADSSLALL